MSDTKSTLENPPILSPQNVAMFPNLPTVPIQENQERIYIIDTASLV